MIDYIREHWLVYLIGAGVAIALGLSASVVVGIWGTTPSSMHEEEVAVEQERAATSEDTSLNSIDNLKLDEPAAEDTSTDAAVGESSAAQ